MHFNLMLDYLKMFQDVYKGSPKFTLFWLTSLAHDNQTSLYAADNDLYEYFLENRKKLDNSFIFFMSDHGPRMGPSVFSSVGHSEVNNPFLYVVLPEYLRHSKIHQQLIENSKEMITHHDIHSTLKDILYNQPGARFSDTSFKLFESNPRGSSLLRKFEEGIVRNCKTLPIPPQYCLCQHQKRNVSDVDLQNNLGAFGIEHLNETIQRYPESYMCQRITLLPGSVTAKEYVEPSQTLSNRPEMTLYEVFFEVAKPAFGKFKLLVVRQKDGSFQAGGILQRVSEFGNHGDCLSTEALKLFCTC